MKHRVKILTGAMALALAQYAGSSSAAALGQCGDVVVNPFGSSTAFAAGFLDVYFAGASAPQNILGGVIATYLPSRTTVFSTPSGSSSAGADYRAFCGTLTNVPSPFNTLNGKVLRLINRAKGGSGFGVYPIVLTTSNSISIMSLNTVACPTTLTGTNHDFECNESTTLTYPPDLGVSDVEPAMFKGPFNLEPDFQTALTSAQLATISGTTLRTFDTMFGFVATSQITAVKSDFSNTDINTILSGQKTLWSDLGVTLPGAAGTAGDNINVCRRSPGSGTQASFNGYFNKFPCESGAPLVGVSSNAPIAQADGVASSSPISGSGTSGDPFIIDPTTGNVVVENPASGDVRSCLQKADQGLDYDYSIRQDLGAGVQDAFYRVKWSNVNPATGTAKWPAVGLLSLDSAGQNGGSTPGPTAGGFPLAAGTNWSYTKIDGVAPTQDNGASGLYDFVSETTFQFLNGHFPATAQGTATKTFAQFFQKLGQDEPTIRAVATPTRYAYVANPSNNKLAGGANCAWTATGISGGTCNTARWTRSGNFCAPALVK
jgi:hypothetical protein